MFSRTGDPSWARVGIANLVTVGRLVLAAVLFVLLSLPLELRYLAGFVVFVLASGSDWVDGFLARQFGQTSVLGRVLDPFVDKVLICGTLIFLSAEPVFRHRPELFQPWMVVVVLSRELLVTALRGLAEERGYDFSAQPAGKLKMVVQSVACGAALFYLAWPMSLASPNGKAASPWLEFLLIASVWLMLFITIYSGVGYVIKIARLWRNLGGKAEV